MLRKKIVFRSTIGVCYARYIAVLAGCARLLVENILLCLRQQVAGRARMKVLAFCYRKGYRRADFYIAESMLDRKDARVRCHKCLAGTWSYHWAVVNHGGATEPTHSHDIRHEFYWKDARIWFWYRSHECLPTLWVRGREYRKNQNDWWKVFRQIKYLLVFSGSLMCVFFKPS